MTPRKPATRANHAHQPSDYESDLNYHSDLLPHAPPPLRSNEELNLTVLKRHDAAVIDVSAIAPYAVIYVFSPTSQQWEKSGIEGTLFVCQLLSEIPNAERYSVMVLNRRGLENFRVELLNSNDVDVAGEFINLQSQSNTGEDVVYGIWVFSEAQTTTAHMRETIGQKIQELVLRAEASKELADGYQTDAYQETAEESTAMGRQLSLKDMLGQQRREDDDWSIKSHSPQVKPATPFAPSADTDFFRSSKRNAPSGAPSKPAQHNLHDAAALLDLFRKTG
ncbi:hypothetical protein MMC20_002803 [Loxospora ochrophaea]|nr:hypothetical protein [Loxospora ochrophaea]